MARGWYSQSALSGSVLVASGAVGAGMFSLPLAAADIKFSHVLLALTLVWLMTLWMTSVLARINLQFSPGTSFDTMVDTTLGSHWRVINSLSIWFIFSILLYAYFTAGGGIVAQTVQASGLDLSLSREVSSLLFGTLIAAFVWSGSRSVALVCAVLLVCMTVSFVLATGGLLVELDGSRLRWQPARGEGIIDAGVMLPYFVTAFACGGLVPSLVKHYQGEQTSVMSSIVIGTFVTFLVYVLWLTTTLGSVERAELSGIAAAGGSVAQLSEALQQASLTSHLPLILSVFSHLAITTSFLGIALSLFDFIADRLALGSSAIDRLKTACLTFLPPAVFSMVAPKGFLLAIGYAGLAVLLSFFIVPALMAHRRSLINLPATVLITLFAVVVAIYKLL